MTRKVTKRFTWPNPIVIKTGLRNSADANKGHQVAHRPDHLHGADGGEGSLPRSEQKSRKWGVGERKTRVRQYKGVQVRGEDVLSSQAEVHTQIDLVGPERDVEAVRHCSHDGGCGRPTTGELAQRRDRKALATAAAIEGLVDAGHGSSFGVVRPGPLWPYPIRVGIWRDDRDRRTGLRVRCYFGAPWPGQMSVAESIGRVNGGTVVLGILTGVPITTGGTDQIELARSRDRNEVDVGLQTGRVNGNVDDSPRDPASLLSRHTAP